MFDFDGSRAKFVLRSVHPGVSADEVRVKTGFTFDAPADVPTTPAPDGPTLALLRGRVFDELGESYPAFTRTMIADALA